MFNHLSNHPTLQPSNLLFFDVALQLSNLLVHSFLPEGGLTSGAVIQGAFLIPLPKSITKASPKRHRSITQHLLRVFQS